MTTLRDKILELRCDGLSYREIAVLLGCSKSTVAYHCCEVQKSKAKSRSYIQRETKPYLRKVENFQSVVRLRESDNSGPKRRSNLTKKKANKVTHFQKIGSGVYDRQSFTFQDVVNKVGDNPACYLSGKSINLDEPDSYEFDHIVPRYLGGSNSLDNLGLASTEANRAKHSMDLEEFLDLCEQISRYCGRI